MAPKQLFPYTILKRNACSILEKIRLGCSVIFEINGKYFHSLAIKAFNMLTINFNKWFIPINNGGRIKFNESGLLAQPVTLLTEHAAVVNQNANGSGPKNCCRYSLDFSPARYPFIGGLQALLLLIFCFIGLSFSVVGGVNISEGDRTGIWQIGIGFIGVILGVFIAYWIFHA